MTDRINEFETDAAIFKFLAAFYSVNPSEEILQAARELSETVEGDELQDCIDNLRRGENILELKQDWTKLFRGVSPEYGPTPPYEQLYTGEDLLALLKELAQSYTEAGFDASGERQDYIGTELAFLSFLAAEAAKALRNGDEALAEEYAERFESFFTAHPGRWFPAFRKTAASHASTGFYKGAMALTEFSLT